MQNCSKLWTGGQVGHRHLAPRLVPPGSCPICGSLPGPVPPESRLPHMSLLSPVLHMSLGYPPLLCVSLTSPNPPMSPSWVLSPSHVPHRPTSPASHPLHVSLLLLSLHASLGVLSFHVPPRSHPLHVPVLGPLSSSCPSGVLPSMCPSQAPPLPHVPHGLIHVFLMVSSLSWVSFPTRVPLKPCPLHVSPPL